MYIKVGNKATYAADLPWETNRTNSKLVKKR